jgi:hypothetical protein
MLVFIRDSRKQGLQVVGSVGNEPDTLRLGDRVVYPFFRACTITMVNDRGGCGAEPQATATMVLGAEAGWVEGEQAQEGPEDCSCHGVLECGEPGCPDQTYTRCSGCHRPELECAC